MTPRKPPSPGAERVARFAERKREAGEVLVRIWTHADDAERVRAYAARLRKQRGLRQVKQVTTT